MQSSSESISNLPKRLSITLACIAMLFGIIGLSGWIFNSFALKSFFLSDTTMKVDTALLIISTGLSLLLLHLNQQQFARVLLYAAGILSLLILAEHIWQINLGIDEWWFQDKDYNRLQEPPGRTSVFTATGMLGASITGLLASYKRYRTSQILVFILFLLVYSVLLGHLFGATVLYRQKNYSGIAIHTALSLLLLYSSIILYQVRYGWMHLFIFQMSGRKGFFYLLLYLLSAAPLLVAFYLYFITNYNIEPATGIIVLVIISAFISVPVAYLILNKISRTDDSLRKTYQRLQIALEAGKLGSYDLDLATGKMDCSTNCKANFGLPDQAILNMPELMNAIQPSYRQYVQEQITKAIANNTTYQAEYQIQWPDDSIHWISAAGRPQYTVDGKAVGIIGITQDITTQKEAEAKKNAFISIVSHELKTPLTSIKAYVQLLNSKAEADGNTAQINALTKTEIQVNKMTGIIKGFLDVARLESGTMQLTSSRFSMNELIEEVLEEYHFMQASHKIHFAACPDVQVTADREKIEHVIANLVGNAVKYSPVNKLIEVACSKKNDNVEVHVKDEGMGICAREIPRLFDRFYRAETHSNSNNISGFGIGLYLSAEIIKLHQGRIWVESEEGKGATFYFSLPIS